MKIDFDTSQVERFRRNLYEGTPIVDSEMRQGMQESVSVLHGNIVARTPVGVSGQLRQSIEKQISGTPLKVEGEVATNIIYGEPVEVGRKPGRMPPVSAIELWVRRKLGINQGARQVAYLIARAIGARGTKGAGMFEKGLAASQSAITRIWQLTGERIAARLDKELDQ